MFNHRQRILLFDIDGTLLDPRGESHDCFQRVLADVYGVTHAFDHYDMSGKTDWKILMDLMYMAGWDGPATEAKRLEAFEAYGRFIQVYAPNSRMAILPGVKVLMDSLMGDSNFVLGLVTGNIEAIVPHKLKAVGIEPGIFKFGAYGGDHIDRNHLPSLALKRLGAILDGVVDPASALVIGDTPRDIDCARENGLKVLSVATGRFDVGELAAHSPDYLLEDLGDTEQVMHILKTF
jgi:phosphoglycolate phosphatase-like HAD superfamily hydrolase